MEASRFYWPQWAEILRRYQMDTITASLLEAGGPLPLLSAQALYLTRPFLGGDQVGALAQMLESNEEAQAFAEFLGRGEKK